MTVTEVARIYEVDVDVIRLLEKRGIIRIERIYDGGTYDPRYDRTDKVRFDPNLGFSVNVHYNGYQHYRRNIDPDELEVLEMLISDMHSGRCREWEVPRSHYQGYDTLYDYIQDKLREKLELEILVELL